MTLNELIHWNRPSKVPVLQRSRFGRSLSSLHEDMDRMVHDFFHDTDFPTWLSQDKFPSIDVVENGESFRVKAEIAGMSPKDVEISVTDGFLTIKGEKEEEKDEEGENYLRQETSYGSFQRVIALPETADCDKAEASFKNGVLKIEVPKKAEALQKPRKLEIKKAA